jgi:hypothetical protein
MNTVNNNPLRQYFRKPAIYLKLPSQGIGYEPGVIDMPTNGELPIYPMTALDEISLKTPDALFNGQAIVDLITSCAPNVKNPWKINNIDMDALLVAIRTATEGNKQEISSTCPSCNEESKYDINLISGLSSIDISIYDEEIQLGDLYFKLKPLSYDVVHEINIKQFELEKLYKQLDEKDEEKFIEVNKKLYVMTNHITLETISKCVAYIKTNSIIVTEQEYILEFLKNCDKTIYETIRDKSIELKEKSKIKPFKVVCINCQHNYEQEIMLNMSDFFG